MMQLTLMLRPYIENLHNMKSCKNQFSILMGWGEGTIRSYVVGDAPYHSLINIQNNQRFSKDMQSDIYIYI